MLQNVALRHREVDDGRGEFEILRAGGCALCDWLAPSRSVLREPHSIDGVNFLKLILAREVEDDASGIALHGIQSGLLDVNVATEGCGAKQVLLSGQQELRLVGAAAHFRNLVNRIGDRGIPLVGRA